MLSVSCCLPAFHRLAFRNILLHHLVPLALHRQLAAKTVTHRKRQTAIQRAIAEHAASSTSPSGRLVPLPSDDEEEDSECSEDEGRQGNDLLDFIEEQTAHVDKSSPLQPWDVDRIKDRLSHDLSLRPGARFLYSAWSHSPLQLAAVFTHVS